jgi:hypothetical protein
MIMANQHLNFFRFFNGSAVDYWEDNLSRAFAICLKQDPLLFQMVLQRIAGKEYNSWVNQDAGPVSIEVDVQVRMKDLAEYDCNKYVAIASSGKKHSQKELDDASPDGDYEAITDLVIKFNDVCLFFEFKRDQSDCSRQLARQIEKLEGARKNNDKEDATNITRQDFSWPDIIQTTLQTLSFQRELGGENPFTKEFIDFLERNHPNWFPQKRFGEISFTTDYDDPNYYYLNHRIKQLLLKVRKEDKVKERHKKYYIEEDWGWVKEIHVTGESKPGEGKGSENSFLVVTIYPGDTKGQGVVYFKNEIINRIRKRTELSGFELTRESYLKLSHFNRGLGWVFFDEKEYPGLISSDFFWGFSGKHERKDWDAFKTKMDEIGPKDWRQSCGWDALFETEEYNRNYFTLSVAQKVQVWIPYSTAQGLDKTEASEENELVKKLTEIIDELQRIGESSGL